MISNHDFISVIPINPPFIFEPLFIVPLIHIGPNICRKRTTLKIVHFSAPIFVQIVILDHHVPRVVNVIVHSHSWLHQANGLLKRIPILSAQGMVVHEHDFYHFLGTLLSAWPLQSG